MSALPEEFLASDDSLSFGKHVPPTCSSCKTSAWNAEGDCLFCGPASAESVLGLWPTLNSAQIRQNVDAGYRVKGIFPERGVGMIYGASGSGKSFLAFHLLGHIAVGAEWFSYRTKPAKCYYMGLEGFSGLGKRLDLYCRRYGDACEPFLRFNDGQPWSLMTDEHVAKISDTMLAHGMKGGVLVIDTMSQAMAGHEENDAASMTEALAKCWAISKAIEGLVILVHHTGKDTTRGPRGSSAITANLDGMVMVEKTTTGDRRFTVEKSKDGEAGQSHYFDLEVETLDTDDDGDPITSCVIIPNASPRKKDGPKKLSHSQTVALEALKRIMVTEPEIPTPSEVSERWGSEAPSKVAPISAWREAAYLDGISGPDVTDDAKRQAFKRATNELAKREHVRQCGDWVWPVV
jgi:hypothetical protein